MAIVEINADVKLLVRALDRIASGIDALLLHAYGIDMAAPKQDRVADGADAGVDYATDESTAASEADAELRRLGYRAPVEDSDL